MIKVVWILLIDGESKIKMITKMILERGEHEVRAIAWSMRYFLWK